MTDVTTPMYPHLIRCTHLPTHEVGFAADSQVCLLEFVRDLGFKIEFDRKLDRDELYFLPMINLALKRHDKAFWTVKVKDIMNVDSIQESLLASKNGETKNTKIQKAPYTSISTGTDRAMSVNTPTVPHGVWDVSATITKDSAGMSSSSNASANYIENGRPTIKPPRSSSRHNSTDETAAHQNVKFEKAVLNFKILWPYLKSCGWKVHFNYRSNNPSEREIYEAPTGRYPHGIHGIDFFKSRYLYIEHLMANPSLSMSWEELWDELKLLGWGLQTSDNTPGDTSETFTYNSVVWKQSDHSDPLVYAAGRALLSSPSRYALSRHIHRFPYVMLPDEEFSSCLKRFGWRETSPEDAVTLPRTATKKSELTYWIPVNSSAYSSVALSNRDVRKLLWSHPGLLFQSLPAHIQDEITQFALASRLKDIKDLAEGVPATNSPKSLNSKTLTPFSDVTAVESLMTADSTLTVREGEEAVDDEEREIQLLLHSYGELDEASRGRVDAWKAIVRRTYGNPRSFYTQNMMLLPLGWVVVEEEDADESLQVSWRYHYYMSTTKTKCWVWNWNNVTKYLKKAGPVKFSQPLLDSIRDTLDPPSEEFLEEVSKHLYVLATRNAPADVIWTLMKNVGWTQITASRLRIQTSLALKTYIYLPYWTSLTDDPVQLAQLRPNVDYFWELPDILHHFKMFGNFPAPKTSIANQDSIVQKSPSPLIRHHSISGVVASARKRPVQQTSVPDTPKSSQSAETAEENLNRLIREDLNSRRWIQWWDCLKQLGWKSEGTSKSSLQGYTMIPPWSQAKYGPAVLKNPESLVLNREYFVEKEEVMRYLRKYGNRSTETEVTPEEKTRRCRSLKEPQPDGESSRSKAVAVTGVPMKQQPNNGRVMAHHVSIDTKLKSMKEKRKSTVRSKTRASDDDDDDDDTEIDTPSSTAKGSDAPKVDWFDDTAEAIVEAIGTGRLDPASSKDVWKFLRDNHGWGWNFPSGLTPFERYFTSDPKKVKPFNLLKFIEGQDYLTSEQEVLRFVIRQMQLRQYSYRSLLNSYNRALAKGKVDMATKGSSRSKAPFLVEIEEEEDEDEEENRSEENECCDDSAVSDDDASAASSERRMSDVPRIAAFDAAADAVAKSISSGVLNPRSANSIFSFLETFFKWRWNYTSGISEYSTFFTYLPDTVKPRDIHKFVEGEEYFNSYEEVLEFVKNQLEVRGVSYESLCESYDREVQLDVQEKLLLKKAKKSKTVPQEKPQDGPQAEEYTDARGRTGDVICTTYETSLAMKDDFQFDEKCLSETVSPNKEPEVAVIKKRKSRSSHEPPAKKSRNADLLNRLKDYDRMYPRLLEGDKEAERVTSFDCTYEALAKMVWDPPPGEKRILLSSFSDIWKILQKFGWYWIYGELNRIYTCIPGLKIKELKKYRINVDYYTSEEQIIGFVRSQFLSRHAAYDLLVSIVEEGVDIDDDADDKNVKEMIKNLLFKEGLCDGIRGLLPKHALNNLSSPYSQMDNIAVSEHLSPSILQEEILSPMEPRAVRGQESSPKDAPDDNDGVGRDLLTEYASPFERLSKWHRRYTQARRGDFPEPVFVDGFETKESALRRLGTAKDQLRPGYAPTEPTGRESEFDGVVKILKNFIETGVSKGAILISGAPGRGKTMVLEMAMEKLLSMFPEDVVTSDNKLENHYKVRLLEGTMLVKGMFWVTVCDVLDIERANQNEENAYRLASQRFSQSKQKKSSKNNNKQTSNLTILVVDEMDKAPKSNIEELIRVANGDDSKLLVIGLSNRINVSDFLREIYVFAPYDVDGFERILSKRAPGIFEPGAAKYLISKAKKAGDIRPMLQIAEKCIEIAEKTIRETAEFKPKEGKPFTIPLPEMLSVIRLADPDPILQQIKMINHLSGDARLLLVAMVLSEPNSESGERALVDLHELHRRDHTYRLQKGIPNVDSDTVSNSAGMLEWAHLVEKVNKWRGFGGSCSTVGREAYRLMVSAETLLKAEQLEGLHRADLTAVLIERSRNGEELSQFP